MKPTVKCLKCQKPFSPRYQFNRICPKCQADNERNRHGTRQYKFFPKTYSLENT